MTDFEGDGVDWPDVAPTEILPGLWMGGTSEDDYIGMPTPDGHYDFQSAFDMIVTLYADTQPAPWGVVELRYGFPDDDLQESWARKCLGLAELAHDAWAAGARVLVRCQQGVNRSGFVTALLLMHDGRTADEAVALLRQKRGLAVLNNTSLERWLRESAPTLTGTDSTTTNGGSSEYRKKAPMAS
jgi:hypothetical protein